MTPDFFRLRPAVCLAAALIALGASMLAPPPSLAAGNGACMACHEDDALSHEKNGKTVSLFVDEKKLSGSVHRGLKCADCHKDAALDDGEHKPALSPVNCGSCHADTAVDYGAGAHRMARDAKDRNAPICADCHGDHAILKSDAPGALTRRANVPQLCGSCHHEGQPVKQQAPPADAAANFRQNIHGKSYFGRGLLAAATCTDCHTSHAVLPATNPASTVASDNVAATCMACHTLARDFHKKIVAGPLWGRHGGAAPQCYVCHSEHGSGKRRVSAPAMADTACLKCHPSPASGMKVGKPVDTALLSSSAHAGVPCAQCHAGADPSRRRPCEADMKVHCANCHAKYGDEFSAGAHGAALKAGKKDAPSCAACHGGHGVKRHDDDSAPTARANIPKLCGDCHTARGGAQPSDYSKSVHAEGLEKKGLIGSAVCTDCHNSHLITGAADARSPVNRAHVTATCANCHRGIYRQFAQGVHFPSGAAQGKKLPVCTDCHSSHGIPQTGEDAFALQSAKQCGSCHGELAKSYLRTMHGKANALGHAQSAKCSDCHDPHLTLSASHPDSSVGKKNISATCGKCHKGAGKNFTGYFTHADHKDRVKYPVLYWSYLFMTLLLAGVFGFFGLHTALWLPRALRTARAPKPPAPPPGGKYLLRFTLEERLTHVAVVVSFLLLALTGLMIKFHDAAWAQALSGVLGVRSAGLIHRVCAVITFGYFFYHLYEVFRNFLRSEKGFWRFFFDKDSLVPNLDDAKDFVATIKWFVGNSPRPAYGRWTYWEKFDYLAVFWGVPIIGVSGLFLWFPEFLTRYLPGWAVNIATIIHGEEALLAIGFIFTIHFFNTHLRPGAFPMDTVIFTGRVPVEKLREEREREYRELEDGGDAAKRVVDSPFPALWEKAAFAFGAVALSFGIILILMILFSLLFG